MRVHQAGMHGRLHDYFSRQLGQTTRRVHRTAAAGDLCRDEEAGAAGQWAEVVGRRSGRACEAASSSWDLQLCGGDEREERFESLLRHFLRAWLFLLLREAASVVASWLCVSFSFFRLGMDCRCINVEGFLISRCGS